MTNSLVKPNLKIVGLHVENFRALRRVDWPADGMGWGETVPDIVMVGGVNGSGKTTLLELIADAVQHLFVRDYKPSIELPETMQMGVVFARKDFLQATTLQWRKSRKKTLQDFIARADTNPEAFAKSDIPGVVYLPTDRRLAIPSEAYKAAGKLSPPDSFFYKFKTSTQWRDSLEAQLYGARWADLNAKEDGHPERATHFKSYSEAFQAFFGDAKQLVWDNGELFVKINDTGILHPIMELSSGEKQALILAAELHRCWRPGSLILIDEPELHFHSSWQTALYTMLERWQKERGGQVIIATQSTHLFRIAAPGTTVLLGGPLA